MTGRSNGYFDLDRVQPSARTRNRKTTGFAVPGRAYCGKIVDRFPTVPFYQKTGILGTSGRLGTSLRLSCRLPSVHDKLIKQLAVSSLMILLVNCGDGSPPPPEESQDRQATEVTAPDSLTIVTVENRAWLCPEPLSQKTRSSDASRLARVFLSRKETPRHRVHSMSFSTK